LPDYLIAIFLGALQGMTEFLPVSSKGHLVILQGIIGQRWMGDVLFNVSVHLGTVLAVIVYFRTEILRLLQGILPGRFNKKDAVIVLCILITTAVTGAIGLIFRHPLESLFSYSKLAAAMLLVTGTLTFLIDRMGAQAKTYPRKGCLCDRPFPGFRAGSRDFEVRHHHLCRGALRYGTYLGCKLFIHRLNSGYYRSRGGGMGGQRSSGIHPLPCRRGNRLHCGVDFSEISGMDVKKKHIFHLLLVLLACWFDIPCFFLM